MGSEHRFAQVKHPSAGHRLIGQHGLTQVALGFSLMCQSERHRPGFKALELTTSALGENGKGLEWRV